MPRTECELLADNRGIGIGRVTDAPTDPAQKSVSPCFQPDPDEGYRKFGRKQGDLIARAPVKKGRVEQCAMTSRKNAAGTTVHPLVDLLAAHLGIPVG